jgi:FkbM family methyltransferase
MSGAYEREYVDFLARRIKGRVLFDVGANIGNYSFTLGKKANRIYAFEASKSNFSILSGFLTTSGLQNIEIYNKAVSDFSGKEIVLFSSPDTGGNNSQFLNYECGTEKVLTISLDDFCHNHNIQNVDFIKVDIEGGELNALRGSLQTLKRYKPSLLVEINGLLARSAGWSPEELFDLTESLGYTAYKLRKSKLTEYHFLKQPIKTFYENIFFITQ